MGKASLGICRIGRVHLDHLRNLYRVFQTNSFSYKEAKENGVVVHGATLGAMHVGGALERVGYRKGSYYAHKWRISAKAMSSMDRRGFE